MEHVRLRNLDNYNIDANYLSPYFFEIARGIGGDAATFSLVRSVISMIIYIITYVTAITGSK